MTSKPIIILSSWSSGSSAITGFLGECGAYLCPPYAIAYDQKTPSTFESEDFRGMLMATVNEWSLQYKVDTKIFRNGFKSWYQKQIPIAAEIGANKIALKHPLSAFLLTEICEVVDPIFVVVTRPFHKIEETRMRRGWHEVYGQAGAQIIYDRIYSFLHEQEKTFFTLSYDGFLNSAENRLKMLDFCDLDVTNEQAITAFEKIIRRDF